MVSYIIFIIWFLDFFLPLLTSPKQSLISISISKTLWNNQFLDHLLHNILWYWCISILMVFTYLSSCFIIYFSVLFSLCNSILIFSNASTSPSLKQLSLPDPFKALILQIISWSLWSNRRNLKCHFLSLWILLRYCCLRASRSKSQAFLRYPFPLFP